MGNHNHQVNVFSVRGRGPFGAPPGRLGLPMDPVVIADALAAAQRSRWTKEMQLRRLQDPYMLPVAWTAARPELFEDWPLLRETAGHWPDGTSPDPAGWAAGPAGPAGLAGEGGQIEEVFSRRVPTRRLVVLGEAGAGKTVLLVRLLLALLERRGTGEPVPVIFSLASWAPEKQDLVGWMAAEISRYHPALATLVAPAPGPPKDESGGSAARVLLDRGLVLPLLDGLDELTRSQRARALEAINQGLFFGQPVVVSSRPAEYRELVEGDSLRLAGAAGIEVKPLDLAQAATYLQRDAGGARSPGAARWTAVLDDLSPDAPLAQVLTNPLGLFLSRTVYNPRAGDEHALPEPRELLDPERFPGRDAIETHLFGAFVPAVYRPEPGERPRWSAARAERTLGRIAHQLQRHEFGTPNLAWWQFRRIAGKATSTLTGLGLGVNAGIRYGIPLLFISWWLIGRTFAFYAGGAVCVIFVYLCVTGTRMVHQDPDDELGVSVEPASGVHWSLAEKIKLLDDKLLEDLDASEPKTRKKWVRGLAAATLTPLALAAFGGVAVGLYKGSGVGLTAGAAWFLIQALMTLTVGGLVPDPPDMTLGPAAALTRDRRVFLINTLTAVVGSAWSGVMWGTFAWLLSDAHTGLVFGVILASVRWLANVGGTAVAAAAWPTFTVARLSLAARGYPRDLMAFLEDARTRGVLRQVGAVYQFRHINLQRHLAWTYGAHESATEAPDAGSTAGAGPRRRLALRCYGRWLGDEHPKTIDARNRLAGRLLRRENYGRAREEFQRLTEINRKKYGECHEGTLHAWERYAHSLHMLGEDDLARREYEALIAAGERRGRGGTFETACRFDYATLLFDAGEVEAARQELAAILEADPSLASARLWLARSLERLGALDQAEREYRRLRSEEDGASWDFLFVREGHAQILYSLGRFAAARATLGDIPDHDPLKDRDRETIFSSHMLLTDILVDRGELTKAAAELDALLKKYWSALGEHDPKTLEVRFFLARAHRRRGDFSRAQEELESVVAGMQRALGAQHRDTLVCRNELALNLLESGRVAEARAELEELHAIDLRVHGPDHRDSQLVGLNLAWVKAKQGHVIAAREEIERIIRTESFNSGVDELQWFSASAHAHYSLARVLRMQGELALADQELQTITLADLRLAHRDVPYTLQVLRLEVRLEQGRLLHAQGELELARTELEDLLAESEASEGKSHPRVLATKHELGCVLRDQQETGPARETLEEVLAARTRQLGSDHPDTLETEAELARL
ncbi:tetratricopeptide repeat protein [Streptomyces sp. NPDC059002]|uniref:tetratricopeptide repeat protein n=1 Tax=Streptomyces sp. NPDC059002 TaxID=3346690 RepID=UPI0036B00142